jgi:hypothetical protein
MTPEELAQGHLLEGDIGAILTLSKRKTSL